MMIRNADINDATGIGKVHVNSWHTTYKNIIPDAVLNSLDVKVKKKQWENNIQDRRQYVIVAEVNHQIVGYAAAEIRRNEHSTTYHLSSIYILESSQGKGLGRQLFRKIFQYFNTVEADSVYVEVLKDNPTKNFYEKYGARHIKDFDLKIGNTALKESLYQWNDIQGTLDLL